MANSLKAQHRSDAEAPRSQTAACAKLPAQPLCVLLLTLLSLPHPASAQTLPSTPPTAPALSATPSPTTPPATLPPNSARRPAQRANVDFSAGRLAITADNASLNQILREISRVTGMKITGGVSDERVFGTYGPADTSTVLSALLNGTGSNMMLLLNDDHLPAELVLTPRQGGPSPPNPNSSRYSNPGDDITPQWQQPRSRAGMNFSTPPNPGTNSGQPADVPGMTPQSGQSQPIQSGLPPGTTSTQSPNGVKTPQQIYDQLMLMQQQQQKIPTPPQ